MFAMFPLIRDDGNQNRSKPLILQPLITNKKFADIQKLSIKKQLETYPTFMSPNPFIPSSPRKLPLSEKIEKLADDVWNHKFSKTKQKQNIKRWRDTTKIIMCDNTYGTLPSFLFPYLFSYDPKEYKSFRLKPKSKKNDTFMSKCYKQIKNGQWTSRIFEKLKKINYDFYFYESQLLFTRNAQSIFPFHVIPRFVPSNNTDYVCLHFVSVISCK